MDYLPLKTLDSYSKMIKVLNNKDIKWGMSYAEYKKLLCAATNKLFSAAATLHESDLPASDQEFMAHILSRSFLNNRSWTKFDEYCAAIAPFVLKIAEKDNNPNTSDHFDPNNDSLRTCYRDLLCQLRILDKWAANKQVLKPECVFAYHLAQTEKLKLSKNMLDHLPFDTFYIDLSECVEENMFGEIKGCFVNVTKINNNEYAISIYVAINNNGELVSYYPNLKFEEPYIEIDTDIFRETELTQTHDKSIVQINNKTLKTFIFQMLCYMSTPEPDIKETPIMKQTYHPNTTIKNKFREVYIQDVGVKIGSIITNKKKQVIKDFENSDEYKAAPKSRKSPIAHFRRAHWRRSRVGKGRKETIVNWIEPTFVCGKSDNVIIHPVK